jgi:GNAT superfamily N-acetyltransferase
LEPAATLIEHAKTPGDVEVVRALFVEYAAGLGVDLVSQGFAEELAELPGKYAPPRGRLLLATVDGRPAGCVALRPLSAGACEMKRLYVRAAYRGSGLGRMLAEQIVREAQGLRYRAIRLDTLPAQMPGAVALYRALGFRPIAPYWDNPLPGVEYLELQLAD